MHCTNYSQSLELIGEREPVAFSRGGREMFHWLHPIRQHLAVRRRLQRVLCKDRHVRLRSQWMFAALVIVGLLGTNVDPAYASTTPIHMSSAVGYNGFYSKEQWIPVTLTLTNDGGAENAELQVFSNFPIDAGGRYAQGTLRWPVHLPAHSTISKQIAVPGPLIYDEDSVHCVVNGQSVATAKLSGTALGQVSLVAVISRNPQLARVYTGLTNGPSGEPILPVSLARDTFPTSSNLLTSLSTVASDPQTLAYSLSAEQRQALLTWVKLGGVLVVNGTGRVSGWSSYLPLRPGPAKTVKGTQLAQFLGDSVTPPKDFQSSAASILPNAAVWIGTSSEPYVGAMQVGRGMILQTSFDPTQSALIGWQSNAAMWTQLLYKGNAKGKSALPSLLSSDGALQMVSASDALSPLQIPSLAFWATVFLIYAILLGPALFFALRKVKSEPLAWFLVPALSIVTTIVIYSFGANQRPSGVLTEGVGVLDLVGDGTAETYGIRGFMSPLVTTGFASSSQPIFMLPLAQHNVRELGTSSALYRDKTTVSFEDVGRWGVRYVYGAGAVTRQGEVKTDFWSDYDVFTGTVANDTPYVLHNVAICWNKHIISIGDLKPGDSVTISRDTKSLDVSENYLTGYSTYNKDILRGIGRPLGVLAARENLFNFDDNSGSPNEAMLVATTYDKTPALPDLITGQAVSEHNDVVLVRQFAPVTVYPTGEVSPK